jgi:hypothetical protein
MKGAAHSLTVTWKVCDSASLSHPPMSYVASIVHMLATHGSIGLGGLRNARSEWRPVGLKINARLCAGSSV